MTLGYFRCYVLLRVPTFPTISECRSLFFGAACCDCRQTRFVTLEKLAQDSTMPPRHHLAVMRLRSETLQSRQPLIPQMTINRMTRRFERNFMRQIEILACKWIALMMSLYSHYFLCVYNRLCVISKKFVVSMDCIVQMALATRNHIEFETIA